MQLTGLINLQLFAFLGWHTTKCVHFQGNFHLLENKYSIPTNGAPPLDRQNNMAFSNSPLSVSRLWALRLLVYIVNCKKRAKKL